MDDDEASLKRDVRFPLPYTDVGTVLVVVVVVVEEELPSSFDGAGLTGDGVSDDWSLFIETISLVQRLVFRETPGEGVSGIRPLAVLVTHTWAWLFRGGGVLTVAAAEAAVASFLVAVLVLGGMVNGMRVARVGWTRVAKN